MISVRGREGGGREGGRGEGGRKCERMLRKRKRMSHFQRFVILITAPMFPVGNCTTNDVTRVPCNTYLLTNCLSASL